MMALTSIHDGKRKPAAMAISFHENQVMKE
jgi:hypothetical protein